MPDEAETRRYYAYCYNDEKPENKYQLVLIKNLLSTGEILVPENSILFSHLFQLLLTGSQYHNHGDPLFDQGACLNFHFDQCQLPKSDFINYTRMMYLDSIENIKMTRARTIIDKRITDWLDAKEKNLKQPPSFQGYLMGTPAWSDIAWDYNTGKKYQHKQDLTALFWNAFVYFEQKFEGYYERHKTIDYETLNQLIYTFRQKFPLSKRVEGVNYFDDLIEQMITKYEAPVQKQNEQNSMTVNEKLNKVLEFVIENKSRHNINHACVHEIIFNNELLAVETNQIFRRVLESGVVKIIKDRYIGWSIDTEQFLNKGGFGSSYNSGTKTEEPEKMPEVFFSYCWDNKERAEMIFKDLELLGITCRKDNHLLTYKDSIASFMESIRDSDHAIILISDEYLKSKNCMTEFSHLMKDRDYRHRILPILHEGTSIFDTESRVSYTDYWKTLYGRESELLSGKDPVDFSHEFSELKIIRGISQNMNEYLGMLGDMLQLKTGELQKILYKPLLEKINQKR